MRSDRELLELAAKAAGMDYLIWTPGASPLVPVGHRAGDRSNWNPLTDDGDALRLAVRLGLLVDLRYKEPERARYNSVTYWLVPTKGDLLYFGDIESDIDASTRRAIVRAAAEIGAKMQENKSE